MLAIGCFLPCKGTNFSANHNCAAARGYGLDVVSYPAKVQIFQLITTDVEDERQVGVVSYPAKVQIFQLITTKPIRFTRLAVVSYPAKVQIFQLITT